MKRLKLMIKYHELVKAGNYKVARLILHLLYKHKISLGLSDESYSCEIILEAMGFKPTYTRNFLAVFKY